MECKKCDLHLEPGSERYTVELCPLHAAAGAMLEALKLVLQWRKGSEGPEILFKEGATMMIGVIRALAKAEGSNHE